MATPPKGTLFIGLDLALRTTGLAYGTWNGTRADGIKTRQLQCPDNLRGVKRLLWWRRELSKWTVKRHPVAVAMEGYAMGAKLRTHQSGELGGVAKVLFQDNNVSFRVVPPATLKKLATGRGNASKSEVLASAIRRLHYAGSSMDEADARWLLEWLLQTRLHPKRTKLPKDHLAALEHVRAE